MWSRPMRTGCCREYVILDVQQMGGIGPAIGMAEVMRHNAAFEPKRMLDYMPLIRNVHGKFYEMTADYVEPSIPYDQIVSVLEQGGYDGYICSEYEGNRWIEDAEEPDLVEQVRRQQVMLSPPDRRARRHRPRRLKEHSTMMDNKMIVEDSLENTDGGFAFLGRLPYYRGLGLSMVEDIQITADGEPVAREDVRFARARQDLYARPDGNGL